MMKTQYWMFDTFDRETQKRVTALPCRKCDRLIELDERYGVISKEPLRSSTSVDSYCLECAISMIVDIEVSEVKE